MSASTESSASATKGALAAAASFLLWGIFPVYWKQLQEISEFELIAHRIVWSLLVLFGVMTFRRTFPTFLAGLRGRRSLAFSALSGLLLSANWVIFIWAVNSGHVIEVSLGYFLAPLGNVALGFLILHERPRLSQWTAIVLAALGVGVLLLGSSGVPWVALGLAGTWSLYGILKKQSPLGPFSSLALETFLLFPLALGFLIWKGQQGTGALGVVDTRLHLLMLGSGIITIIPLLLFAYGTRRLRMTTLGLLQYLSPTVQFLLGLYVYHEPFDTVKFNACLLIWLGLLVYTADSFWTQRRLLWAVTNKQTLR